MALEAAREAVRANRAWAEEHETRWVCPQGVHPPIVLWVEPQAVGCPCGAMRKEVKR